jgi:MHS family proline/betaine transporter-like MFS transporter
MPTRIDPLLKIAFTASLFEWYGFSLTVFMAVEIGRLFFPVTSDKAALISSFSVFAASYLARPFGSVFFGMLGNRFGAGSALKLSMIGMSIPSSLIAFLPTYQTAGFAGTALFIGLKMLQGFSAGGEMPLNGYFVSINATARNRGLYCALVVASGFLGMSLASCVVFMLPHGVNLLSSLLPNSYDQQLPDSWRWPFLLCIPLSIWIYSLRSSIFTRESNETNLLPNKKPVLPLIRATSLVAFMEVVIYTVFIWLPNYLQGYLGVSSSDAGLTNIAALGTLLLSMLSSGYLARWIDASKLVFIGIISLAFASYPLFWALDSNDFSILLLVQMAFAIMAGCLIGVIFIVLSDLFKDNWRSLGMASTYSIATAVFGGTAPIVCSHLIEMTHLRTAPALYIIAMSLLAAPTAHYISARKRGASTSSAIGARSSFGSGRPS